MSWKTLEAQHPELAALGAERLNGKVAYPATLREGGAPRVHPPHRGDDRRRWRKGVIVERQLVRQLEGERAGADVGDLLLLDRDVCSLIAGTDAGQADLGASEHLDQPDPTHTRERLKVRAELFKGAGRIEGERRGSTR